MVRGAAKGDSSSSAGARSPEAYASVAAPPKPLGERATQDNNDADGSDNEHEHKTLRERRSRHQSDADRQNELERQRETSRAERIRSSLANNRFLSKKQAPQAAESGPERSDEDDTDTYEQKQPPQQQQDDSGDARDSVDDDTTAALPPPELTIVPKKRSSVAISTVHAGADASNHSDAIVHPHVHLLPSVTLRRSKWTQELADAESCGLFVEDKRAHLSSIHPSTLVRLEERLRREEAARQEAVARSSATDVSTCTLRLTDLIHTRKSQVRARSSLHHDDASTDDDQSLAGASSDSRDSVSRPKPHERRTSDPAATVAMLEIRVDRIILDDHESFALSDRISAQLRSLYAAYGQLLQQQPWQLHLDRVGAFVDAFVRAGSDPSGASTDARRSRMWESQTVSDAELALNELAKLQLLHQQTLAKWAEMQECGRQSGHGHVLPYRVQPITRSDPIDLRGVQALVEILSDDVERRNNNQAESSVSLETIAHFSERLEALEVQDKCLRQVLRVDSQHQHHAAPAGDSVSPSGATDTRRTVFRARRRKFYVAIFVNGKQAFTTRAQPASGGDDGRRPRGLVLFGETFCLKVPYFPESLAAKVFEQGVVRDSALSTAAVPIILPGQSDLEGDEVGVAAAGATVTDLRVPVASLAPSHEWYQFSSTRPIARARWHHSFLNSSLYVNFARHPHGRVHVATSWVSPRANASDAPSPQQELDATCYLPPKRPPLVRALMKNDRVQLIGSGGTSRTTRRMREELKRSGFSYERDFLVHMQALESVLDPNDPENAAAMRLQRHLKAQSQRLAARDVFRTSSLAFGHTELFDSAPLVSSKPLTKRNELLQLRDREHTARHGTSICDAAACRSDAMSRRGAIELSRWQHDVFESPVPLDEGEIAANEKYLALLRPEIKDFDRRLRVDHADEAELHSIERQQQLNLLKIHDFMDRVKQNQLVVTRSSATKDKTKTLASIIQEQPLPLFPGALDFSGLGTLFAPRRRLRPQAMKRLAPTVLAEWPSACDLYIQVQKAANVPVRMTQRESRSAVVRATLTRGERSSARQGSAKQAANAGGGVNDVDDNNSDGNSGLMPDKSMRSIAKASPGYASQVFVEICFQGKKRRTSCSIVSSNSSANPMWMETLVVPFRPPFDDWSPESIQRCRDDIRVNLFDQVVVSGEADDERLDTMADPRGTGAQLRTFHQENYFLGGLCIPFTTLYHNSGSLEATLRCEMPVEHLGYVNLKSADDASDGSLGIGLGIGTPRSSADDETPRRPARSSVKNAATDERDEGGVKRSSREATFLSLMMTLDPLLPLPVKLFDDSVASVGRSNDAASDATKRLVQYASDWAAKTRNTNAATKRRNFHVFVRSLSSGNTFLPQFVGAQQPPRTGVFAHSRVTLQKLVRFVQLIPFLADWHLFDGAKDVWSTSQEFLGINAGDYEEHAVLLCNYLHWLDRDDAHMRTYLVLGHAVPEGDGVYVLRQDAYKIPQRSVLWNASTGVGYHVWDDRCPMRDVSLVVSRDNVFANVQQPTRFQDLTWDVEGSPKAWKPFFSAMTLQKDAFALPSVQVRDLVYEPTPDEYVRRVEAEISETLKREIRRWRSGRVTTTFNIDAGIRLRAHLEELEQRMQGEGGGEANEQPRASASRSQQGAFVNVGSDSARVLRELQQTREISGMPLNTTFTDLNKVIELVKNTNIHWNERAGVEFALAVYACAFPNAVVSVWVYFVSLAPSGK